ncbi:MAG: zinc ABC transporter substrate-binding protein [Clostridia bacterium]|nr:zinc ABC transporter substrate-binding protein [Clostridia bacterium]
MKRFFCVIIAMLLLAASLSGCRTEKNDGVTDIVCTVFPIYDWTENVIGDESEDISLSLIVKNGTDPHSYSPTPADIAKISSCDVLIYVGGESDAWVSDVLRGEVNEDMRVIRLIDTVSGESAAEGHEGHDHAHTETAYDEHIWLSLKNAKLLCRTISDGLCEAMPERAEDIRVNLGKYLSEIDSLDRSYSDAVLDGERDTLLFADRFPFGYLVEDYGLKYYAAFEGCSTDSEASFETVTFLAKKLRELSLDYVIILENSDRALADTVIAGSQTSGVSILIMNSMQSITETDIEKGTTYLGIMRQNLSILKLALA